MRNYEFAWECLKAAVEASAKALDALEEERMGDLGKHGNGMRDAFNQVLRLIEESEARG